MPRRTSSQDGCPTCALEIKPQSRVQTQISITELSSHAGRRVAPRIRIIAPLAVSDEFY
jgi:hypothetical protein